MEWPDEWQELDFDLPEELIAQVPVEPADHARLMVIDRQRGSIEHDHFYNLGKYLRSGDTILYNATSVEERRVLLKHGDREHESVFLRRVDNAVPTDNKELWEVLLRKARRIRLGTVLHASRDPSYTFQLVSKGEKILLATAQPLKTKDFIRIGEMPLPPYLRRPAQEADRKNYQNFFSGQIAQKSKILGSAASPTAALHFTTGLYEKLRAQGVLFLPVCLDVGYGTFAPLQQKNFTENRLHAEHYFIPPETLRALEQCNQRRIALGTTSLRAIISYLKTGRSEGETELFLKPGDKISGVEGLITNFHLPRSSLILLVAAFCGVSLTARAYRTAVAERYRFYSYGDAMLIV
ncbi:MAG: tRNA preQ1(34) S-adenosylmethionine ribosyltransferase-isomerase QueA [Turneriella sp.]|nr:tRNA preQ1(34) S-adenosylmethionine ribosyltransferase-isomerase QueA [Turneriella sp.]